MDTDGGVPKPTNRNATYWYSRYLNAHREADRNKQFRGLYDAERTAHENTREDLRLNKKMLARQCDLAREAEVSTKINGGDRAERGRPLEPTKGL